MKSHQIALKVFLFLSLFFLSQKTFASDKHNTNFEENITRTSPITHFSENVWIYTKLDSDDTGYQQVFMMYHDPATSTGYFTETRLTSSLFDKKNPQWGPAVNVRSFATFPGPSDRCNNGQTFLFLGDQDGDSNDDLYLNCIENFPAAPTLPLPNDVQISGLTPVQTFDIEDYDVDYLYTKVGPDQRNYYQVIFTTEISGGSGGEMHHLLFRPQRMVADGSYYHFDSYSWGALWTPIFGQYRHPKFLNQGNNIVYSGYDSSIGYWQLGSIYYQGSFETQITALTANDVSHPQVTTFLDSTASPTIVFVVEGNSFGINQLAYIKGSITAGAVGMSLWCEDVHLLSDTDANRDTFGLDPHAGNNIYSSYELEQPDSYHDIYYGYKDPSCATTYSAAVNTMVDDFFDGEYQLTCNEDNHSPLFLADMNTDSSHTAKALSATSPYDIAMLEIKLDGSDYSEVHLHNNATVPVCEDTCYENADGSSLTTAQDADGNGIKDECEGGSTTTSSSSTSGSTTSSSTSSSSSSSTTGGTTDGCECCCDEACTECCDTTTTTTTTTTTSGSTSTTTSGGGSTTTTTGGTTEEEEPAPVADVTSDETSEIAPDEADLEWGQIFKGDSFKSCGLITGTAVPSISSLFLVFSVNFIPFVFALFYQRKKLK